MEDVGKEGRTVLFVSHNMTALKSLCSRAIWLNSGMVVEDGETSLVVSNYLQNAAVKVLKQVWDDLKTAPGNEKVRLRSVRLIPQTADENTEINVATPLRIEFVFWNFVHDVQLNFSMHLYNAEGLCIFNTISGVFKATTGFVKGSCFIPGNFLNDGVYRVKIMMVQGASIALYNHQDILVFEVHDIERSGNWYGKWAGIVRPAFEWDVELLDGQKELLNQILVGS
jgi:lipopolysaccharide transport system ATP-binding protein